MQTQSYLYLSLTINLICIILLCLWEVVFRKQNKEILKDKELISFKNKRELSQNSLINILGKTIEKLELEIQNKKGTIKYLSDQNIILNNEVGNIDKYYAENSESIKVDRLKKGNEKFIQILQTSK